MIMSESAHTHRSTALKRKLPQITRYIYHVSIYPIILHLYPFTVTPLA